ncbi:MAG TPA: hypothetical protein VGM88_29505 [Kofleriaceae bacterium]
MGRWVVSLLLLGCVAPPVEPTAPALPSRFARVSIIGAVIGPCKSDGHDWDGPGSHVDPDTTRRLVRALGGSNIYGAAAEIMTELAQASFDKPDVFGTADLLTPSGEEHLALPLHYRDNFTPEWSNADFPHVPLDDSTRIRVSLIDKDLVNDDVIGTVELNRADLEAALRAGAVFPVPVFQQSANQILFIRISVIAAQ